MDIAKEVAKIKRDEINRKKGFFKRDLAQDLKDSPEVMSDEFVAKLCDAVLKIKLNKIREPYNEWLRRRNSAIISTFYLFPKRSDEVLSLKIEDVWFEGEGIDRRLMIRYLIQKRSKRLKVCPSCGLKQAINSNYCRNCATALDDTHIKKVKSAEPERVTKPKFLYVKDKLGNLVMNPFVINLYNWIEFRKTFVKDCYLFPPLKVIPLNKEPHFDIYSKMTTVQLQQIMRAINPAFTSYTFRYHRSKWELIQTRGDINALKKSGDWSSLSSVEHYIKSLGLTREDKINAGLI
ncbi:MAG: hypothetical protein ACUVTD_01060 [Nitrososphaerales archaeon]